MEYRYHIPDFMRHFRLNLILAEYMEDFPERFREGTKIASVYGAFPNMVFNGGRFISGGIDVRVIKEVITRFNSKGIPLRFTLTNPLIEEKHLKEPFCNAVLKAADNGLNEAIVMSPLLEEHIRKNFPGMKITSSTCKEIRDIPALTEELEKDYSLVVLDYNFNNDFEAAEKLPHKEKIELLINPCCTPQCKRRGEHYRSVGRSQIKVLESLEKTGKPCDPEPFECPCMLKDLYRTTDSPLHIDPEGVERYARMGIVNFKIEGRSVPDINVLENYVYYMVKPEYKDRARLDMLIRLTRKVKYF
ncbi:MAG: hypothetical protein J6F31_08305 [Oscillospiraceae bacterium]|nr:hypothetical protein [Oscillospiraceae bacterium]